MQKMPEDKLKAPIPKNPKDDKNDEIVRHIKDFYTDAEKIRNREMPSWINGQEMYLQCLDPTDDLVNLFNPDLLFDTVQRALDQYKLADYKLTIPGLDDVMIQVIRDAIRQVKISTGLISGLRDNPKGALSQLLLGVTFPWWGTTSEEEINQGIPLRFQFPRLSQVLLSSSSTLLRTSNGENDANEGIIIFEFPKNEVNEIYKLDKDNPASVEDAKNAKEGKLSFVSEDDFLQQERFDTDDENQITQVGHYYNLDKGIYYIIIGEDDTIVEKYDDRTSKLPDYPHQIDDKNVMPLEMLKSFPVLGQLYPKGFYHKFAKIARNDARMRNLAHRYVDRNIDPDRIIEMPEDEFASFQNQLEENQLARQLGMDSYIQVNPGSKPVFSDGRTAPLSGEFERMKQDTVDLVKQGGIAIQDVDRPASESATATAAEEIAKTRIMNQIAKLNAGSSVFLTKVIVEGIKLIPSDNEIPVNTTARAKGFVRDEQGEIALDAEGQPIEGEEETPVKFATLGAVADALRENKVFIEEDISQFEGIGLELARIQAAFQFAVGTPSQIKLQQKGIGLLGQEVMSQDLTPLPDENPVPTQPTPPKTLLGATQLQA